jgi:hypothetical protein
VTGAQAAPVVSPGQCIVLRSKAQVPTPIQICSSRGRIAVSRCVTGMCTCMVVLAFLLFKAGAAGAGGMHTESRSVEIEMGAGDLTVSSGVHKLLEARLTHGGPGWRPEIDYRVSDSRGELEVRQPGAPRQIGEKVHCEWDLRFSRDVPIDLGIEVGAGDHRIEVGDLTLTDLDINVSAGNLVLSLGSRGSLTRSDVNLGAGDVTIDLTGEWRNASHTRVNVGAGSVIVILPAKVGVRAEATVDIGNVSRGGLMRADDGYVNEAYGKTEITLNVTVNVGHGEVALEVAHW